MIDQFEVRKAGLSFFYYAIECFMVVALLLVGGMASRVYAQVKELPKLPQPVRMVTVQGQVSLPEGMPAGRALVTLISRDGVPRQTYTTEQGRFEFSEIQEGGYSLTARSVSDPNLVSERVETDTSRTATSNLSVNLTLHKEVTAKGTSRTEVVTIAEADQRVPKEARRAFREAIRLRQDKEPDKALESLSRAVELYPDYFQALTVRGDLQVLQHRLAEAAADFERALKINPLYEPALRGAGYCKMEKREFAEAIKILEKAITAQPDNANTYLLIGIANLELDRREAARQALFKALSFNSPHELRAHIYLGNLFARERLYKDAADELHKYLEESPRDPDATKLKAIESQWRALAAAP